MPSLLVLASLAYLCVFLAGVLTLAPDAAEETYVELSDTEPRIPWVLLRLPIQARGRSVSLLYNFLLLPSCSLRTLLIDPIHLYAMFKTQTDMIPTSQQTIVLLSYRCSATD